MVLRVDAKVCHVEIGGRTVQLPLAGKLFEQRSHEKRPVAVGDRVRIARAEDGAEFGAIDEVLPRTSRLARRGSGDDARAQVLAANISLVLVVASIRDPQFQADLVDKVLAAAEREEIAAALVLTKTDRDRKGQLAHWRAIYEELGYPVYATSIVDGDPAADPGVFETLREQLRNNVTTLAGLSGVGKSSLLNVLMPGLDLRIGSIGRIKQGKHTTTHTQLIPLPGGGHVLDTPGIRNFTLFSTDAQELTFYFREIREHAKGCAYRDCTHQGEPDCAVAAAVESGEIAPSRWTSFRQMFTDLADRSGPG